MPPQHRVRLYDHQGGPPLPPPFGEQDPKESIPPSELPAIEGARQRGQLLTEREVLERNRPVPTTRQHIARSTTTMAASMWRPVAHWLKISTCADGDRVLANHNPNRIK